MDPRIILSLAAGLLLLLTGLNQGRVSPTEGAADEATDLNGPQPPSA